MRFDLSSLESWGWKRFLSLFPGYDGFFVSPCPLKLLGTEAMRTRVSDPVIVEVLLHSLADQERKGFSSFGVLGDWVPVWSR